MRRVLIRLVAVVLWSTAAWTGYFAATEGDERLLIGQLGQALLGVLLWLVAPPPGVTELRAPVFGTRALRLGLYWTVIAASFAAAFPWLWPRPDPTSARDTYLFLFAMLVITPLLQAERKARSAE